MSSTADNLAWRLIATAALCSLALACSTATKTKGTSTTTTSTRADVAPTLADKGDLEAKAGSSSIEKRPAAQGRARALVGKAYQVAGRWFEPKEDPTYDRTGTASWYGAQFHGRRTANGEVFDRAGLTAAHPTLPLPSYVRVTNLQNDRSIVVRVNDRGPFSRQRLIDVSEQTAELLDFKRRGMAQVRVEYVDKAEIEANDAAFLLASYRGPADDRVTLASLDAAERGGGISRPGQLPPPKAPRRKPPEMAFDAAGGAAPKVSEAVVLLSAPASPEDRIFTAFETASAFP